MQVIAQRAGFYGADYKRPGQTFDVADGLISTWFAPPQDSPPVPAEDAPEEPDFMGNGEQPPAGPGASGAGSGKKKSSPAPEAAAPDSP